MINVMDLLSLPQFNGFKIISDSKGLRNVVRGTGIWEWERPEVIEQTFLPGEFVFTTLSVWRDDEAWAVEGLKTLIRKKVSAIAIKTVYFDRCPEEILSLAGEYKVPVLTFSEAYMDDLIYVIKNAILSSNSNSIMLERLKEIMRCENEEMIAEKSKRLNPLFFSHLVCFCCFAQGDEETDLLNKALLDYQNSIVAEQASPEACYSFIRCNRCIIIIYTFENSGAGAGGAHFCGAFTGAKGQAVNVKGADVGFDGSVERQNASQKRKPAGTKAKDANPAEPYAGSRDVFASPKEACAELLNRFIPNAKAFHAGASSVKHSRRDMKQAIDEAVIAALSATLENETLRQYDEIGADAFLLSNIENRHFRAFYRKTHQCLSDYDDKHNSDLMKTLICYVESECDIALTSKRLFQHNNTVRYRLDKIKKLLNIMSSLDTEIQFYVFVRMHKLEMENLLARGAVI